MHTRTAWLALLLTAGMTLAPNAVRGQHYMAGPEVPFEDPPTVLPLGHDRPEEGGFFVSAEFLWWRQTNPLRNQLVAVRGLVDTDGSIQDAINHLDATNVNSTLNTAPNTPAFQFGSHLAALNVDQVSGPGSFIPGFAMTAGWRFGDGWVLQFTWRHLETVKYTASAGPIPANLWPGYTLADTYMFSPVFNFPAEYGGPAQKVVVQGATFGASGNGHIVTGAAFGIWNGASDMSLEFIQRSDEFELVARVPIYQGEYARSYGWIGGRHVQMWERFTWRAQDNQEDVIPVGATVQDLVPLAQQNLQFGVPVGVNFTNASGFNLMRGSGRGDLTDLAIYSNVVSNRLYGPVVGCGTECYLGCGFSFSLDLRAGLLVDFVKEVAKYERGDRYISSHRTNRNLLLVPELDAFVNVWWYPINGVQVRAGYDLMNYFGTASSRTPVSFNYGALDPPYSNSTYRLFNGFHAGIGFTF